MAKLATEKFYVYENWTHNLTKIHRGSCSYCNEGTGIHDFSSGKNDKWSVAFDSYNDAKAYALSLGYPENTDCEVCFS